MNAPAVGVAIEPATTLASLLDTHGGTLDSGLDPRLVVRRIGPSDRASDAELAPVLHERGRARLATHAPVLLVDASVAGGIAAGRRWVHPRAEVVLATLLAVVDDAPRFVAGPLGAWIDARVSLPPDVQLGPNVVIHAGVSLGRGVRVGAGAVIGRRGFGYLATPDASGRVVPMPHRTGVVVEDDVEIGALATIDAGVLHPTRIGRGSLLDAHVHVGHGAELGARVRAAAQVGIAGSVRIDDDVWIGGQAGFADHVHVGRGARIAAKAGVIGDVPAGAVFAGYPAIERGRWLRALARSLRR